MAAKKGPFMIDMMDKDGNTQVLLNSLGFSIPKGELELLLSALHWKRMKEKNLPGPDLTIANVKKFKDAHYEFFVEESQRLQEEAMKQQQEKMRIIPGAE